jgi:hypothetical protein
MLRAYPLRRIRRIRHPEWTCNAMNSALTNDETVDLWEDFFGLSPGASGL